MEDTSSASDDMGVMKLAVGSCGGGRGCDCAPGKFEEGGRGSVISRKFRRSGDLKVEISLSMGDRGVGS